MTGIKEGRKIAALSDAYDNNQRIEAVNDPDILELKRIIENESITSVFQPIVSLESGAVLGYEALSRGPAGSCLEWPERMFATANQCNLLWELDVLCRVKALDKANHVMPKCLLFLNIDPTIIYDSRFQKELAREALEHDKINPSRIVFEITEKTVIEDYKDFQTILDRYTSQGYQIALDDTGSGYSGLTLLAQTWPQYVKLDMELIRNIDKDSLKQSLIRALYHFSQSTNMKLIAEGVETVDELNTVIDIGVPYAQGFLLRRPAPDFLDIPAVLKEHIQERNNMKQRELFYSPLTAPIGEIARLDLPFSPKATGNQVAAYFNNNPEIQGIVLVDDGRPVGLLSRSRFLANFAVQHDVSVYMNHPVELVMDRKPLIVDYKTSLDQVNKFAVARPEENMYDYIIVTKDDAYYGVTSILSLLERTTRLEFTRAKYSNPLTGLPGNLLIERELKRTVASEQSYAVLYLDLNNFKPYNDVYGFEHGDRILVYTAQTIQAKLDQWQNEGAFLGHIGGDEFIAIVRGHDVADLCEAIIAAFDQRIAEYYHEQDYRRGFIVSKNRHGYDEKFPIIAIAIAVVTGKKGDFDDHIKLREDAGAVKEKCKLNWRSCYHIA